MSTTDKRCCGSGVCIINDAGECWCGQVWNGEKMVAPTLNLRPVQAQSETSLNDKTPAED
jgi:hypothetical protein